VSGDEQDQVRGLLSRRFVWVAIMALAVTGIILAWVSLTAGG
jgi:hypothetical protein